MPLSNRRCTNFGLSPAVLLRSVVGRSDAQLDWPQFRNRKVTFTHSGRTAIAFIREALGLEEGDVALVSGYNCGTEIDSLIASGLVVRAVDVEPDGSLTIEALEQALCPRTRLIYVIHQFGWPQPIQHIDTWRRSHGLLLAEDCALALFGELEDGEPIGLRGEACIYSLTKSLPVPDGGVLTWTTAWNGPRSLKQPSARRTARSSLSLIRQWAQRQRQAPQRHQDSQPAIIEEACSSMGDIPSAYYFEPWRIGLEASNLTRRLLTGFDWKAIRDRRRQNYSVLSALVGENGWPLLFDALPKGVCPLSCPVIVDQRDKWVDYLWLNGISTSPWWSGGHRSLDWNSLPQAMKLKQSVLPLPVHQQLNDADMRRIASVLSRGTPVGPVGAAAGHG